jgi:AcrR family transcriptional regulator
MSGGAEALLDAALAVIARDGLAAATARAVAAEAGVSPGTVSHHFPSIEAMLRAALQHGSDQAIAELERLALDLQAADWEPDGWAVAFASALDASLSLHPERHIACVELQLLAVRRPELRPVAQSILAAYLRLGRLVLQAVGSPDPGSDAVPLVAMVTGLVMAELGAPPAGRRERLERVLRFEVRRMTACSAVGSDSLQA